MMDRRDSSEPTGGRGGASSAPSGGSPQVRTSANDRIADRITAHAVQLHRFEARVRLQVLGILRGLREDLLDKIRRMDLEGVKRDSAKRARAEKLLKQTRETIRIAYGAANQELRSNLRDLARVEGESAVKLANAALKADVLTVALAPGDLRALANDLVVQGSPAYDWWRRQSEGLRMSFAREIRLGVAAGETTGDLVRRIRGRQAGREAVIVNGRRRVVTRFAGGIMDTQTRQATALVRTSVQSLSNEVLTETYKANDDVVEGVVAIATLDGRTTEICMGRDGGAWDLKTGDPLPDSATSERYPGPPPWHFNCRTVLGPKTKSWDQLIDEAGGKVPRKLKDVPPRTRASMDGQVPAKLTYTDWLKQQPESFQRDVLGRGRYELWKDGKLKHLSQLTDQTGNPLDLEQLLRRVR